MTSKEALISSRGTRELRADAFFDWVMTTRLAEDELLVEVRFPLLAAETRFGFYEFSRRAGDYAIAMSLVTYMIVDNVIAHARVGIGGAEIMVEQLVEVHGSSRSGPGDMTKV